MEFAKEALEKLEQNTAKIATIRLDKDKVEQFKAEGFGITLKLKLGHYSKGLLYRDELVQALCAGETGCLNKENEFMREKFELRKSVSLGRIKKYLGHMYIDGNFITDHITATPD